MYSPYDMRVGLLQNRSTLKQKGRKLKLPYFSEQTIVNDYFSRRKKQKHHKNSFVQYVSLVHWDYYYKYYISYF